MPPILAGGKVVGKCDARSYPTVTGEKSTYQLLGWT